MFKDYFGSEPQVRAQAPGRVNLLGEHTDYNDGFVFPTPLVYQTQVEAGPSERIEAYAERFGEFRSREIGEGAQGDWLDYVAGCVWVLRQAGYGVGGLRAYITSQVPAVGGLSSSAALEVAVIRALRELYHLPLDDVQIALLAQKAEVGYVGVRCGIMDQMAASAGRLGQALFLDTRSLESRLVPLPEGYRVVVLDSGVPRRLAESGYNTRRAECEEAARLLGVKALRDVGLPELPKVEALPEPINRRARHVVTENARVLEGIEALRRGDVRRFGELMYASHTSLRDDYEVSIPELDELVEVARKHGAIGARLTGAGFGGAAVALIKAEDFERFKSGVLKDYPKAQVF